MANQTVTKTPDQWKERNSESWRNSDPSGRRLYFAYDAPEFAAWYRQFLEIRFTPVSACSLKVRFLAEEFAEQGSYANVVCTAYGYDENDSLVWQKTQTYYWSMTQTGDHTFTFSDIGGYTINTIVYKITSTSGNGSCTAPTASYTYNVPTLGLSVTPSSLYVGETIRCTVSEPFYQSFNVSFAYNNTVLQSFSTDASYFTQTANESWFSTAGVTGNSMQVTVTITDGLGRTASARVTVNKHTALVPSITAPKGGSFDGGQSITFAWSSSGDGYQTQAVLQYSLDNVNWSSFATINGTGTQWTAPAGKFSAGTVYWRLRLTNNWGLTSDYVFASFTVVYNGASVTLTTPTSGSRDGAEAITFGWSITPGSGSVTGTRFEISTDDGLNWTQLMLESKAVTSYTSKVAQFPAGRLLWRVSARDSYTGWGEWKQASVNITYSAVSQTVAVNSPTSGIINTASNKTFTVALQASAPVYAPFTVASATFFWRSGETGAFTEVAMTPNGNTASVTIPGGTIPSGRMEWYASATDNTGRTTETPHYVLTAMQADVEAAPLSPWNTIESGSGPIPFRWAFGSLDGSPQGRAQLQYSTDDTAWLDENIFADLSGDGTSYTAPAGTFPGGTVYWRVRAYNEAGTAGAWSEAASFTVYAAPQVLGVTGDGKPFLTVTWQTTGQEAFELEVNGKTYGPYFGADVRSYTLPEPLADGTYTARVRAQNRYGLWSEWAEAAVQVTNVRGPVVWLTATDGESSALRISATIYAPTITSQPVDQYANSGTVIFGVTTDQNGVLPSLAWEYRDPGQDWQPYTGTGATSDAIRFTASQTLDGRQFRCRLYNDVGEVYTRAATYHYAPAQISYAITGTWRSETGYFLVFRDGVPIGKTFSRDFIDRTGIGKHKYFVMQILPGGYYTGSYTLVPGSGISATATATSSVDCPMIAPLAGGDFIQLALSDTFAQDVKITRKRSTQKTYYSGSKFPSVDIGEHEEYSASLATFWIDGDSADADTLEAMLGEEIILKLPKGRVLVGVLDTLPITDSAWRRAYTVTLGQDDWSDFVDDT